MMMMMCRSSFRCCWMVCLVVLMSWRLTAATDNHVVDIDDDDDDDGHKLSPGKREDESAGQLAAVMDRLTSLDRSMAELKDQMVQVLKLSSGAGAHKVLQDLQGVCEELRASGAAGPGQSSTTASPPKNDKCPPHPDPGQLMVTAVMNEETETAYIVTVCYVSPEKPEVMVALQPNTQPKLLEDTDFGVVTVKRQKEDGKETTYLSVAMSITQSEYFVSVAFQLYKNSTGELYLPDMYMTVEPAKKIMSGPNVIYQPGSDVDLKVNVINGIDENVTDYRNDAIMVDLKSRTEPEVVNRYRLHPDLELPEELSGLDYTVTNHSATNKTILLHLPYSPERERGVMHFQVVKHMIRRERCFVSLQMAGQSIAFYPKGKSGPFPHNFVGFVDRHDSNGPFEEDNSKVKCYEDGRIRNCFLGCMVMGDNPTITLRRADPAPISGYTEVNFDKSDYFASAYMEITDPVEGDAGDYVCEAKSRDGRHVIKRTLTVTVERVASIVHPLTQVETFLNGTLMIACTAEGRPLPQVSFGPNSEDESNPAVDQADVTVTQLNATMSRATLVLDDWRQFERNDIDNIFCKAKNLEHDSTYEYIVVDNY